MLSLVEAFIGFFSRIYFYDSTILKTVRNRSRPRETWTWFDGEPKAEGTTEGRNGNVECPLSRPRQRRDRCFLVLNLRLPNDCYTGPQTQRRSGYQVESVAFVFSQLRKHETMTLTMGWGGGLHKSGQRGEYFSCLARMFEPVLRPGSFGLIDSARCGRASRRPRYC